MKIFNHPDRFREGTRVLLLTGRNKDSVDVKRTIHRISKDEKSFEYNLAELILISKPGERIYASASQRDYRKAAKIFMQEQIEAQFGAPEAIDYFYRNLERNWVSALMRDSSVLKSDKLWMFDCDSNDEYAYVKNSLADTDIDIEHEYNTVNGYHVLVKPYHIQDENLECSRNPMMLWFYNGEVKNAI